ncbi:hypothetical protein GCM10027413_02270 [Conyzicola nivalis]|uniref:Uncharacterized protein n=1 Tax=Conyzicola nivalis TaxID=1477021 RepID=A0A916SP01_9MICO|nr:hypothetical protein [Conyzicola nivalis]GGB08940.1 hypothetical protein GCM10010979_24370 [Conyzicola nivalis]
MILDSASLLDPAQLEARHALSAQLATLARALAQLERARAGVPPGAPSDRWRGPAQSAYGSSVRQLGAQLDQAIDAVRSAKRCTARALATMASRG